MKFKYRANSGTICNCEALKSFEVSGIDYLVLKFGGFDETVELPASVVASRVIDLSKARATTKSIEELLGLSEPRVTDVSGMKVVE